jgi:Zn-finger nucleic acid-binding protein
MESLSFGDIAVDCCSNCGGIWFDMLEKERLKKMTGSEAIDRGDPALGKTWNRLDDINCPVDGTAMIRMVDPGQHHIWFESCPNCYGAFFDAGEFSDYKHEHLVDFFRDLMTPERK